ncbi:MAG: hypothetical protein KIT62_13735 [Cyclobacteriaceae bacterium]|nr:hypothetical protein [Cyclobacteriaceae bacterium]
MTSRNQKLDKLIERVHRLVKVLDKALPDFTVSRHIDKFWYVQKLAELTMLRELNRADIESLADAWRSICAGEKM